MISQWMFPSYIILEEWYALASSAIHQEVRKIVRCEGKDFILQISRIEMWPDGGSLKIFSSSSGWTIYSFFVGFLFVCMEATCSSAQNSNICLWLPISTSHIKKSFGYDFFHISLSQGRLHKSTGFSNLGLHRPMWPLDSHIKDLSL